LLLQLAGLGLVVIGSWLLADDKALNFLGIACDSGTLHGVRVAATVGIVAGIILVIVGLAGCWGACAEKTSCLNIVSLSLSVLLSVTSC